MMGMTNHKDDDGDDGAISKDGDGVLVALSTMVMPQKNPFTGAQTASARPETGGREENYSRCLTPELLQ
jgi:hypothetical protein